MTWRDRTERGFERLADIIAARPLLVLVLALVLVVGLAANIPSIKLDTTTEGFLAEDDPAMVIFNRVRETFGRSDRILLAVETEDVFTLECLRRFSALHQALEEQLPHLESVDSLINARYTHSDADTLMVEDLLERIPQNAQELQSLKKRVMGNPFYRDLLISGDARLAVLAIKPLPDPPPSADQTPDPFRQSHAGDIIATLDPLVEQLSQDDFRIHVAGAPAVVERLKVTMATEMSFFMRATLALIALFLVLLFRRPSGVALPLVTVVVSLLSTVGLMAFFGAPIQLPTTIVPSFLLSVAVGDSVHLLALFYKALDDGKDKLSALREAMGHTGLPILLTSLTTAAGLLSFAGAKIVPVANLGLFSAAGVMLACGYTVVLLPAMLCLLPVSARQPRAGAGGPPPMERVLQGFASLSIRHPRAICLVGFLLLGAGLTGAAQLRFSHNPLGWLPESYGVRQATSVIDARLGGTVTVDVLVDTGVDNGLQDPELLTILSDLAREMKDYQDDAVKVGKVTGITDLLQEVHQALNGNDPEFYAIPGSRQLVAQELLLFETSGGEDLELLVDFNYRSARYTLMIPWIDTLLYGDLIDALTARFKTRLGDKATVTVTGLLPIMGTTLKHVIHATGQSYFIAFLVISLMMVVFLGSLRYGLVSMLPNLLPIVSVMGLMWLIGIPLDMFTMLIASIAIGITVDDTVHFMYHFKRSYQRTGDAEVAIRETLNVAGRAMLVTSVVLSGGFFVFMGSAISNLIHFGLLTGCTIVIALLGDFLFAPALMVLMHPKRTPAP